jgi:ribonuclease Z
MRNGEKRAGSWAALIGIVCCTIFLSGCVSSIINNIILQNLTRTNNAILEDPGIHVIMAGNGSPQFDKIRNPQCIAVIAGGKFMLFDTGDGCARTLDSLNMPITKIDTVFLTHYHSDHTNGLGHLISHTWLNGRTIPIDVYGPPGIENVVNGFAVAAREDILLRSNPASLFPQDQTFAVGVPHVFPFPEDGTPIVVFNDNGLIVKAFKNDHVDVSMSVGYRIEYAGRIVVISGDTVKCPYVTQNAAGADLLIHDATNKQLAERAAQVAEQNLGTRGVWMASRIRAVIQHHSSTIDAAEVARDAGVGELVITHVIPGVPDNDIMKGIFTQGMSVIYKGKIVVVKDGDQFYLPPK